MTEIYFPSEDMKKSHRFRLYLRICHICVAILFTRILRKYCARPVSLIFQIIYKFFKCHMSIIHTSHSNWINYKNFLVFINSVTYLTNNRTRRILSISFYFSSLTFILIVLGLPNENNFRRIFKRFLNILMITKDFNINIHLEMGLKY